MYAMIYTQCKYNKITQNYLLEESEKPIISYKAKIILILCFFLLRLILFLKTLG